MGCLDEDLITDLAAGRVRLDAAGVEEHLAECLSCATLLGAAVAEFDERSGVEGGLSSPRGSRATGGRPASVLAPGTVLKGSYIVQRLVGSGGMGEVYEVGHVRLAGRYAVKVLRAEICGDQQLPERFRREAEITSVLRHPHIVQVIDFDRTEDGCVFLAMEYLEGCDLAALLARDGHLTVPRTLGLVSQVVAALAAAHRQGIVHRDLKPANVFVIRDDDPNEGGAERVKLMDFGLSKWAGTALETSLALSRDQTLIGTPRYMAPEQARGRNREVSPATDQFALAALTYEMLSGEPPFRGGTLGEILHAILYEQPRDLRALRPELPPALVEVVHRGLAKQPGRRFSSIQAFGRALAEAGRPASSPPAGWRRGLRLGLVGLGGAAGAAALGLFWWGVYGGTTPARQSPPAAIARPLDLARTGPGASAPDDLDSIRRPPTVVARVAAADAGVPTAVAVAEPARPRRHRAERQVVDESVVGAPSGSEVWPPIPREEPGSIAEPPAPAPAATEEGIDDEGLSPAAAVAPAAPAAPERMGATGPVTDPTPPNSSTALPDGGAPAQGRARRELDLIESL